MPGWSADCPSLAPVASVGQGLLVGPLGYGQTLQADEQAGLVHHREHVPHPLVLFADEESHGPLGVAEGQDAGGAGVDAHLVLDGDTGHVVAGPQGAVFRHELLRDNEAGDPLGPRRGVGRASEDEVDDVRRQVVLAETDEDLRARDPVGPVRLGYGPGPDRAQIRSGVGFGETHGARPLAGDQLR